MQTGNPAPARMAESEYELREHPRRSPRVSKREILKRMSKAVYVDELRMTSSASGFSAGLKVAAGALAAVGAAGAVTTAGLFRVGSAAVEVDNVVGLAFGAMKDDALAWSDSFAAATGTSKFEAREFASDLGLMIRGMGFGEKAALNMSTRMVALAADMSSAKNVPLPEALEKIRAGLVGESEPLRVMGVLLSAARVKEVAYAEGIAKRGAELTEAQKVEARMQIILRDSTAMHGDLVNTLDSGANQWRHFRNDLTDAATAIGVSLMPAFSAILGEVVGMSGELEAGANKAAEWISAWLADGGLETVKTGAADLFGVVRAGAAVVGDGVELVIEWRSELAALGLGLGAAVTAYGAYKLAVIAATVKTRALTVATKATPMGWLATAVGVLVTAWSLWGDEITGFLGGVWSRFLGGLQAGLDWVRPLAELQ